MDKRKMLGSGLMIMLIALVFMGFVMPAGSAEATDGTLISEDCADSGPQVSGTAVNNGEPIYSPAVVGSTNNPANLFYAYIAEDSTTSGFPDGPCSFPPSSPGTLNLLAPTTSSNFISGATWVADATGDKWYGCQYGDGALYTIDHTTGIMTYIGDVSNSLDGLAYDPLTKQMYGANSSDLFIVDMATGAQTLVGPFNVPGLMMIGIAFDGSGNLYGVDIVTDSLYAIDPSTGAATLIGPLGIGINFAQDMAYDFYKGRLYLSAYGDAFGGRLYICDTDTGAVTLVGNFQNDAEITGFAIPYGATKAPALTPLGLIALVGLLSTIAATTITRRKRR